MPSSKKNKRTSHTPKGEQTKATILEVAARLFDERSYHGTSLQTVANAAGLSKMAIYHHFPNKESLLVELQRQMMEALIERQADRLASADDPVQLLREMILDITSLPATSAARLRVFIEQFRQLPENFQSEFEQKRRDFFAQLVALLQRAEKNGSLNLPCDANIVAQGIIGMCWSYAQHSDSISLNQHKVGNGLADLALFGLQKR